MIEPVDKCINICPLVFSLSLPGAEKVKANLDRDVYRSDHLDSVVNCGDDVSVLRFIIQ